MRWVGSLLVAAAMALAATVPAAAQQPQPRQGGALTIATIGEPPTLDPMESTADVVGLIAQHVFETLYTWGDGWRIVPLLAASDPQISADGKEYVIPLRTGVRFHDGQEMTSADVLASLQRWMRVAVRGRTTAEIVESMTAPSPTTIRIVLKQPYAPLMALLSLQTSAAIIMPANKQPTPLTEFIGTGPYRFRERQPDRYVLLSRFENYSARSDATNMYGGRRTAYIEELRFVPVPNAATRIEGALSGQYGYVDSLPVESVARLRGQQRVEPIVFPSFGWPLIFLNTRDGVTANPGIRRAIAMSLDVRDMLEAAFGGPDFYQLDGAYYPQGWQFHSTAGAEGFNRPDPARARAMAREAGYNGQTIRFMTTQQFDFHYKMSLVAAENMRAAGFTVDLQVLDWATQLQRRPDGALWDMFFTHGPILPEPTLYSFFNSGAPGWWSTPTRNQVVSAFSSESNPQRRAEIWGDVQRLIYSEVPIIKLGNFNALAARARGLNGVQPAPWPFFWNAWLQN
ncbi:MAG: ABC transporter substrate-binding protein [Alphaproteobacteria bacterium]|nr:ABC transporter substrate-binding protein [Alphaproteobacteria bacterium]